MPNPIHRAGAGGTTSNNLCLGAVSGQHRPTTATFLHFAWPSTPGESGWEWNSRIGESATVAKGGYSSALVMKNVFVCHESMYPMSIRNVLLGAGRDPNASPIVPHLS